MYCFYFREKGASALYVFEAVYCFITWAFVLFPVLYYLRYSVFKIYKEQSAMKMLMDIVELPSLVMCILYTATTVLRGNGIPSS